MSVNLVALLLTAMLVFEPPPPFPALPPPSLPPWEVNPVADDAEAAVG